MMAGIRVLGVIVLVHMLSLGAYGQATVNISPGDNDDDIYVAMQQAGPGGTVIFAPGRYDVKFNEDDFAALEQERAIHITPDLEGITLQGAGPGTDPSTATILDGDAWFPEQCFRIEASNVVIDGFTIINFQDEAIQTVTDAYNVEIRNCWILACDSGFDTDGNSGWWDETAPDDFSEMLRIQNCVFARGGDDGTDIEGTNAFVFINCDFYDWDDDILDNEDTTVGFFINGIIHGGYRGSLNFYKDEDSSTQMEARNSLFFGGDDPAGDLGGINIGATVVLVDCIEGDPLYVNVGQHVHIDDLDFHLLPDSPALTLGKDEAGNPTFAGSQGPAE